MTALLIAVGVLCAINTGLALLLMLAAATLGRVGPCRITINGEKEMTVAGGRSLLATLKDERIFIPSACGGRGSCGLCKVTVLEGAGPLLPTETPWLTPEEQKANIRLACQVKVRRDLQIRIPDELFQVKQYRARVADLTDLTHDIKQVTLDLEDPPEIHFKAGQYIQLEVPPYALTDEPVYRAYSVASGPADTRRIELEIRYVPNGICTTYVHKHLRVGDTVTLNGPYGEFGLTDSDAEMLCIAGGSGMAPIKSILTEMARTGNPRRCRYFFGARARRDLFLLEFMRELEKTLPDFRFIPALSNPDPADHWEGEVGRVTEVVARHVRDASQAEAFLCGSPLMIDACIQVLREKGMPESKIFYDKF
ncbi:MAG TPA: 2Fe-2S iron-sulfur cluster binding domain-containing protein [Kiritimatiellia bacterium]|nr:2Fe-2S iron-sulfur cluster binding domain-containing protein [Kiritimatiellia bacterium]HRU70988.1 2Fe-2S iron-sulfur cluster binding domain-containing protein [Kiritimatiellia bacterium]